MRSLPLALAALLVATAAPGDAVMYMCMYATGADGPSKGAGAECGGGGGGGGGGTPPPTWAGTLKVSTDAASAQVTTNTDLTSTVASMSSSDALFEAAGEDTRVVAVPYEVRVLQDGLLVATVPSTEEGPSHTAAQLVLVAEPPTSVNGCLARIRWEALYARVEPSKPVINPPRDLVLNVSHQLHHASPDGHGPVRYLEERAWTDNPSRRGDVDTWTFNIGIKHVHVQYVLRDGGLDVDDSGPQLLQRGSAALTC